MAMYPKGSKTVLTSLQRQMGTSLLYPSQYPFPAHPPGQSGVLQSDPVQPKTLP